MQKNAASNTKRLSRKLTVSDATFIGLGSMLGAGVFVSFGPATKAAGQYLIASLAFAALIAWCNAISSARLASRYPESGGAYVYGTKQLGPLWGFLAGWSFIIGKLASCAAISLTIGHYLMPSKPQIPAILAVTVLTLLNLFGVKKSTLVTKFLVITVMSALILAMLAMWTSTPQTMLDTATSGSKNPHTSVSIRNILQGAAFMFFAFAGYARIATLGEEVQTPQSTIPRAIRTALMLTITIYVMLAVSLIHQLGIEGLAHSVSCLDEATKGNTFVNTLVKCAAVIASISSLLTLILGVSRTTFAMARDRNLPHLLSRIHSKYEVPYVAELFVGIFVVILLTLTDLNNTIAFSSFAVLVYYAIANASAWTLSRRARNRLVPLLGLIGCGGIAVSLSKAVIMSGLGLLTTAALIWFALTRPHRSN